MGRRTLWDRGIAAPVRAFLRTESGSSGVLAAAILAALIWSNLDTTSYDAVWHTDFSIHLGSAGVSLDLRTWINSGLMTLFFLVVGLEARREFDLGDLRDRSRFVLPCVAGLAGMLLPVLIYLAVNRGGDGAHGWGVAMSTDTALALGLLALFGRRRAGPYAGVPPDGVRGRRPGSAGRDRCRIQRVRRPAASRHRGRSLRLGGLGRQVAGATQPGFRRSWCRHLGSVAGERRRPGGRRARDRPDGVGLLAGPRGPRASYLVVQAVP